MAKRRRRPATESEKKTFGAARGRFLDYLAREPYGDSVFRIAYLIVTRMNAADREAFPGYALLAREAHCSTDTISRAIAALVRDNLLIRLSPGQGTSPAHYTLDWKRWEVPTEREKATIDPKDIPF
jgi:hypothetical protein